MQFPFSTTGPKEFDVIGFGTNAVDYLIQVPHYPEYNSKVELIDYTQAAGGEVATAMVGLQRLGLTTAYVGRFGRDPAGEFGLRSLKEEGVDVSRAECIDGAGTQIAFIVIDARSGERTVIWKRDSKLAYTASEAPVDFASKAKVLHFTPHDASACVAMAGAAKQNGVIVSIDIDNIFPGIEDLLPLVDLMIATADLPAKLTGIADSKLALREIVDRFGCGVAGITLGEKGSILFSGGEFIETPGFEVPGGCMDTTGAGDSYRAGLIYGFIRGEEIEQAARTANAVAALKCRSVGARTSLPTQAELTAMLNSKYAGG
jgi:sugar/nucleoside kinase (ribokinase family)